MFTLGTKVSSWRSLDVLLIEVLTAYWTLAFDMNPFK
jgi:hypothetical protein